VSSGKTAVAADSLQLTTEAMRFGQEALQVKVGQEVTLLLDNRDLYGHSFDVDVLNIHVKMPANGRTAFTFTPTETGTHTIYCAVPGHREAGMVSTLVVGE
jgi:plastocyanin